MRCFIIILSIVLYSCSTGTQIQLPIPTNYVSKGYVDTAVRALRNENVSLLSEINSLKTQRGIDKNTIDSLKKIVTINTVYVDTTSGSDFLIKKGVMTFNTLNLRTTIKAVLSEQTTHTLAKKRRKTK